MGDNNRVIEILKEDFSQTVEFIDKCDNHIFQVKNWAILTSSAVIAFTVSQGRKWFALANFVILIAFLYLELIYKSFQDTAIEHTDDLSKRIEKYLVTDAQFELLDGYKHSYGRNLIYPSLSRVWEIFCKPTRRHILIFYGLLALYSLGAFLVVR